MSKKFKSHASSARAASASAAAAAFGSSSSSFGFGGSFQTAPSSLSYITEFPDLSSISDPNVIVSLRNLGKKDSTTKSKALEELQEYITSAQVVESGLLDAWVSLYPRTSIDNSRRVRQLSHTVQGALTVSSGKRIAPLLPRVIGSWLSGAYDSDKAVARAAQESIATSFSTDEKRRALWKVYKDALVKYAQDAILDQTPQTLSDERSTSPDDAEAKFIRVVGNGMHMLTQTIKLNFEGASSAPEDVRELVTNKRLWEYAYHSDPSLRRGTYSLIVLCIRSFPSDLDYKIVSTTFVGKALHISQLGSSTQLSEALLSLTNVRPELWTSDYTLKTSSSKRLQQYLRNGSQHGLVAWWKNTALLLRKLPSSILSPNSDDRVVNQQDVSLILDSLRTGISHRDEPRNNLDTAWNVYVETAFWLIDQLPSAESNELLFNENLLPVILHYISPNPQISAWVVPTLSAPKICSLALLATLQRGLVALFRTTWENIAQSIADGMRLSLPESSADFKKSQDAVIACTLRFLRLRTLVLQGDCPADDTRPQLLEILRASDDFLTATAIHILKARNGKPYGAAAFLETMITQPEHSESSSLTNFLAADVPTLIDSPSAEYFIGIQLQAKNNLSQTISTLIHPELNQYKVNALVRLLSQASSQDISQSDDLTQFISQRIVEHLDEEVTQALTKAALQNPKLKDSESSSLWYGRLLNRLHQETDPMTQHSTLEFMSSLLPTSNSTLPTLSETSGTALLSSLLILSDSQHTAVAELSASLASKLRSLPSVGESVNAVSSKELIAEQLSGEGAPLPIFTVIDLANEEFGKAKQETTASYPSILPSKDQWSTALEPYLSTARNTSLAITSPLQGLLFLIAPDISITIATPTTDAEGFSLLFRLTLYTTKVLSNATILEHVSEEQKISTFRHYPLAFQLLNEKFTLDSANKLWLNNSLEIIDEAADVLAQGSTLLQDWSQTEAMVTLWSDLIHSTSSLSPPAYLDGLAFTDIMSRHIDVQGPAPILTAFEKDIANVHRSTNLVRSVSLLSATHDYLIGAQNGRRILNELIALCTELKTSQEPSVTVGRLVLLNTLLGGNADALETIPNQRVVFLMQALLRLLGDTSDDTAVQCEVMKLLDPVISATADIYGDHWEQILDHLSKVWVNDNQQDNLPLLHASLRLYGRLKTLSNVEDINEDLSEAWASKKPELEDGLKQCLESFSESAPGINQPRRITADLLRRHIVQISPSHDPKLYLLLSSAEDSVRGAAYDLLHRSIPKEQEGISLDLALEKVAVHLPTDLTNLLIDTPSPSEHTPATARQSYLLAWHLVFDHFTTASYQLREAYSVDIKSQNILPGLLNLICDVCRITSGRPLDVSKVDVKSFEPSSAETEQAEEQHLVVHLYYCSLLFLPSLTRSWFIEQKNRVKTPLETWTQKYFTSTLTSTAIATVTEWVAAQPQDDTEAAITVKSSTNGSEAVASIAVDPESPPISLAITLPSSYPLESPTVSSRTRVGVSEKNWQSWLRTFQIIIFSTGSIIEGLIAFRRNVQGALKGQSECAICYSIIGTDMQTPNKRCGTCRNTFHSVCLFRWFKSSNSSSCPLCRNNFNYA
ncbi:hypothetical protein LTR84_005743 [Exophiala bonariae]|uniref:E3 ubiquitin-protein ligase listerin n=1 Tax=Exophiala bonariae TaxID=1690606 RepID=A0AAV9N636_9EURO|nr:hypothetical protein LTR84_005743 [Exophiala bonariae]